MNEFFKILFDSIFVTLAINIIFVPFILLFLLVPYLLLTFVGDLGILLLCLPIVFLLKN